MNVTCFQKQKKKREKLQEFWNQWVSFHKETLQQIFTFLNTFFYRFFLKWILQVSFLKYNYFFFRFYLKENKDMDK